MSEPAAFLPPAAALRAAARRRERGRPAVERLDDAERDRADSSEGRVLAAVSRARLAQIAALLGVAADCPRGPPDPGRRPSRDDLAAAREMLERIGREGEMLAWLYLGRLRAEGRFSDLRWSSEEDASSAWDFEAEDGGVRFDAKATTRRFEAPFQLSAAETLAAACPVTPYRIVRVCELTARGGYAALSGEINHFAEAMVEGCANLPRGARPTGFSVEPERLDWEESVWVGWPG